MSEADMGRIPVTIITGFLGAGKTTLLNRILREPHGHRIAVIENEFGEEGIDNEILFQERGEQIVEMNNGCICCTVRGDLVRILGELSGKRRTGRLAFDRVVIETTGLADPAPVAQTFFVDQEVSENFRLDAIVTVVDARHAPQQLDEHHEAQEQVGFADRILLSKTDLVTRENIEALERRLSGMNQRAKLCRSEFGRVDISEILDIRGFDLDAILDLEPDFLGDHPHEHDDDISSFVYRTPHPFVLAKLEAFLGVILQTYGADLLRYKGVLSIDGQEERIIFQGVHMLWGSEPGRPWAETETRDSTMVFIGRRLPRTVFEQGLRACVIGEPLRDA